MDERLRIAQWRRCTGRCPRARLEAFEKPLREGFSADEMAHVAPHPAP